MVAFEAATYSLEMKAPEIGNTENRARNQTQHRTRAGNTMVYDRGINLNETKKLKFNAITDLERSELLVFLEAVQWGATRLRMSDYKGTEYIVRINSTRIEYTDTGFMNRNDPTADVVLWDFDLDILDLTNTDDNVGGAPPMSSALGLHLTDFNDPHNPQVSISLDIADGAKVVESFNARDWKAVSWLIVAEKNAKRLFSIVSAEHNGYGTTDATLVTTPTVETLGDTSGASAEITFTVVISGAGASQIMTLKAATTVDGYTIRARRTKL